MVGKLIEKEGVIGVVLDPDEEAELTEDLARLEEEERDGHLQPADEMFARLRDQLRRQHAR